MDSFRQYEKAAGQTDHGCPTRVSTEAYLLYLSNALGGESGELGNEIKKMYRDDGGTITPERRVKILHEAGDMLWYLSRIAVHLHSSLDEIAHMNVVKLAARHGPAQPMGDARARAEETYHTGMNCE